MNPQGHRGIGGLSQPIAMCEEQFRKFAKVLGKLWQNVSQCPPLICGPNSQNLMGTKKQLTPPPPLRHAADFGAQNCPELRITCRGAMLTTGVKQL